MRKIIGILLLLTGFLLLFYPQFERKKFDADQQELMNAFVQLGEWKEREFAESEKLQEEEDVIAPLQLADGVKGILEIDKIDLQIALFDQATEENLLKGVGIIEPEKEIGKQNIGIAGHRSTTKGKQFNRLGELKEGDRIQIKTYDDTYTFNVTKTYVVHQSEISVLKDQTEPMITLVTCTPLGSRNPPDRLIVQAQLIEGEEVK